MARIHDMKQKEIINVRDGGRYGYISDIDFDDATGSVKTIIIPGPGRIFGVFGREQEYVIPWDNVKQIGEDIILVDVEPEKALVDLDESY